MTERDFRNIELIHQADVEVLQHFSKNHLFSHLLSSLSSFFLDLLILSFIFSFISSFIFSCLLVLSRLLFRLVLSLLFRLLFSRFLCLLSLYLSVSLCEELEPSMCFQTFKTQGNLSLNMLPNHENKRKSSPQPAHRERKHKEI